MLATGRVTALRVVAALAGEISRVPTRVQTPRAASRAVVHARSSWVRACRVHEPDGGVTGGATASSDLHPSAATYNILSNE